MGFQPRKGDTAAPATFRRFIEASDREIRAAMLLINRDYVHVTSEQLLNVIVELKRRGEINKLNTLLEQLAGKRAAGDIDEPSLVRIV